MHQLFNSSDKSLESWPQDWPDHIIKSNELYFDESRPTPIMVALCATKYESLINIPFQDFDLNNWEVIAENIIEDKTSLQIIYVVGENGYIADYTKDIQDSDRVLSTVYRMLGIIEDLKDANELSEELAIVPGTRDLYICRPLGYFKAASGYDASTKLENLIEEDWDDDNDDDFEDEPSPSNPTSSLDTKPVLSY